MDHDNFRDDELDKILSPLRQVQMSDADLTRVLTAAGWREDSQKSPTMNSKNAKWQRSLAFAAGLAVGFLAAALLLKSMTTEDQTGFTSADFEEFATVRHVIANEY